MKNLFNAALLLRDDVTTVEVVFTDRNEARTYYFVVPKAFANNMERGDVCIVPNPEVQLRRRINDRGDVCIVPVEQDESRSRSRGSVFPFKTVTVLSIQDEPRIDLTLDEDYEFILAKIESKAILNLKQQTIAMAERIRDKQRQPQSSRESLLVAHLGLTIDDVKAIQSNVIDDGNGDGVDDC